VRLEVYEKEVFLLLSHSDLKFLFLNVTAKKYQYIFSEKHTSLTQLHNNEVPEGLMQFLCKSELNTWSKLYMYINILCPLNRHTVYIIHIAEQTNKQTNKQTNTHTHTHTHTEALLLSVIKINIHYKYMSIVFPLEAGPPFLQQSACVGACIPLPPLP
jgi:hypothetical protein